MIQPHETDMKTVFIITSSHDKYLVISYGLVNHMGLIYKSSAQRILQSVFVYTDDILIFSLSKKEDV